MADVIFKDFTVQVKAAIDERADAVLEEVAGELESQAARNTRRDSGQTAGAWAHKVDSGQHMATIGNTMENSIWEEFGTGEYAINGNGRKGGWVYKDDKGDFYYTTGKKPSRAFWKAYSSLKNKIIKHIQDEFKGLK